LVWWGPQAECSSDDFGTVFTICALWPSWGLKILLPCLPAFKHVICMLCFGLVPFPSLIHPFTLFYPSNYPCINSFFFFNSCNVCATLNNFWTRVKFHFNSYFWSSNFFFFINVDFQVSLHALRLISQVLKLTTM
jgi:hypothetical protein